MHCLGEEVERLDVALALLARWVSALRSRVGHVLEVLSRVGYVALRFLFGGEVQNELQKGSRCLRGARRAGLPDVCGSAPAGASRCVRGARRAALPDVCGSAPGETSRCLRGARRRGFSRSAERHQAGHPDVCGERRAGARVRAAWSAPAVSQGAIHRPDASHAAARRRPGEKPCQNHGDCEARAAD
jgi:hypothetical protein